MKVLFQNPRWATATFSVSAVATCATAAVVKPTSKAIVLFMAFSHRRAHGIRGAPASQAFNPP
jgi:hypothetical protein